MAIACAYLPELLQNTSQYRTICDSVSQKAVEIVSFDASQHVTKYLYDWIDP